MIDEMARTFPFSAECGLALGFTEPPTQRTIATPLPGAKYQENKTYDSLPNAEVNIILNMSLHPHTSLQYRLST